MRTQRMYLWRRSATSRWVTDHERALHAASGNQLAVVERPDRKRPQLEVASKSRSRLQSLRRQFGGRIEKLPHDWLKRALRRKTKPVKVGNKRLVIPAGAAFGTGQHATTAMSLRLLEKVSRDCERAWSMIDLGTGSGILALTAKLLGATRVIGIDNDPTAISTAKQNARLNRIRGVQFRLADLRRAKLPGRMSILTANLFSELLIEILPKLKPARCLILSGILRNQERDVRRALRRNQIAIVGVQRRGKWVAMVAARR